MEAEQNIQTEKKIREAESIVIRFSGDSGDGMQLTGIQFSDTAALLGNDIATFPDFPSEIRAPVGTVAGVSGFQLQFGSKPVFTVGDQCDLLVAMNAAALKADLHKLKKGGTILANLSGFDQKNLRLAGYDADTDPLDEELLSNYIVHKIDITKHTKEALSGSGLGNKEVERSKNMFVLGLLFWMFDRSIQHTENYLREKFSKQSEIAEANVKALHAGWNYGENTETLIARYRVSSAQLPAGNYRSITGNHAMAIGLVAASEMSGLQLFLGTYPITPASDILHELSKYKSNGVKTFQAEDEIAGICAAIGASYGGLLGVTTTSGPGMSLKTEALGFAVMLEIPLVVVNVQRGGPSTGLPTKTEQSDLLQAMFGRHGEAPLPVLAASSPADCFEVAYEASRMAITHMTPVVVLSDGYIANGSEPWKYPKPDQLKPIDAAVLTEPNGENGQLLPYKRNESFVRPRIIPGTKGMMHRIGGLEKQNETGNVSYDPLNHELMTKLREQKISCIADDIPLQKLEAGSKNDAVCVLGWGSTFGAIKTTVSELNKEGYDVAHIHLRYIHPFPKNLGELLSGFKTVVIPEMNNRQLVRLIRDEFLIPAQSFCKVQGQPFKVSELKEFIMGLFIKKNSNG